MTNKEIVLRVLEGSKGIPLSQEYIGFRTFVPAPSIRRTVQELLKAGKVVIADRRGYRQGPRFLLVPPAVDATVVSA